MKSTFTEAIPEILNFVCQILERIDCDDVFRTRSDLFKF